MALTAAGTPVLAHYGGAPEVLTIALPLVIFGGFMYLEKRARRREREQVELDRGAADEGGAA